MAWNCFGAWGIDFDGPCASWISGWSGVSKFLWGAIPMQNSKMKFPRFRMAASLYVVRARFDLVFFDGFAPRSSVASCSLSIILISPTATLCSAGSSNLSSIVVPRNRIAQPEFSRFVPNTLERDSKLTVRKGQEVHKIPKFWTSLRSGKCSSTSPSVSSRTNLATRCCHGFIFSWKHERMECKFGKLTTCRAGADLIKIWFVANSNAVVFSKAKAVLKSTLISRYIPTVLPISIDCNL